MDEHDDNRGPVGTSGPDRAECQEALESLYHYLDGELDEERRRVIHQHLERCSPCLEAFDFEAELKVVIAHRCRETVPDGLRKRVAEALADASRTFRAPP